MRTLAILILLVGLSSVVLSLPNPDLRSTIEETVKNTIKEIVKKQVHEALENAIDTSMDEDDDSLVDQDDEYTKDDPADEMDDFYPAEEMNNMSADELDDATKLTKIPDFYLDEIKAEKLNPAVKEDETQQTDTTTSTGPMPEETSNIEALMNSADDVANNVPSTEGEDGPSTETAVSKKGSDDLKELEDTLEAIEKPASAPESASVKADSETQDADDAALAMEMNDELSMENDVDDAQMVEDDMIQDDDYTEEKASDIERLDKQLEEVESELKQALGDKKKRAKAIAVGKFCKMHPSLAIEAFGKARIFDGLFSDKGEDTPDEDIIELPDPAKGKAWEKENPKAKQIEAAVVAFCKVDPAMCIAVCQENLTKSGKKGLEV